MSSRVCTSGWSAIGSISKVTDQFGAPRVKTTNEVGCSYGHPLSVLESRRPFPRRRGARPRRATPQDFPDLIHTDLPESHRQGITAGAKFSTGAEEAAYIEQASGRILDKQPSATIGIICRSAWRRKAIDAVFAASSLPNTRWDLAVDDARIIELLNGATTRLGVVAIAVPVGVALYVASQSTRY